jgi:hypothetical protein
LFAFSAINSKKIMKAVKKFSTFEDLKSYESKPLNYKASLKKHQEFEKIIMDMKVKKVHKGDKSRSKQ